MRKYEVMLILPAEADDKVVSGATDRITGVLGQSGGEVQKVERWGRRRLAYELDRHTEGFYLVVEFTADPASLRELDRVLSLADEVIRFKVAVLPEKAAARGRERAGVPRATARPERDRSAPPERGAAVTVEANEEPVAEAAAS